jgi:hypothetical protein
MQTIHRFQHFDQALLAQAFLQSEGITAEVIHRAEHTFIPIYSSHAPSIPLVVADADADLARERLHDYLDALQKP